MLFAAGASADEKTGNGSSPPPKRYDCVKASSPIVIDGRLDEPAWASAAWTDDFVDIEGDARPRPRFRTRARMTWDDRYFYLAAELIEPNVWATLTRHDSVIFQDPDFEVFIDPDGDNHEYYEIEINALNTEWDLFLPKPYRDGGRARDSWEVPGFRSSVHVRGTLNDPADRDEGWAVEMAIPWSALAEYAHRPSPPRDGDTWRVNFSRVEWDVAVEGRSIKKVAGKREDNWVWSPQGVIDMHRPERWGYVRFLDSPTPPNPVTKPDPDWPARERLMRLYESQRAYHKAHGRWAMSIDALGLAGEPPVAGWGGPRIGLVEGGYVATMTGEPQEGRLRRVASVRSDSRLVVTPENGP
jgi:hypothetical protein